MKNFVKAFCKNESGAITVDWVVITAAVVGMSAIGFATFENVSQDLIDAAAVAVASQDDFD